MDWQIRLALFIIGVGVIGFIVYDFNRRKKIQKQKQQLIDQVRTAANHVDSLGFDSNGVGHVRKTASSAKVDDNSAAENSEDTSYKNQESIQQAQVVDDSGIDKTDSSKVADSVKTEANITESNLTDSIITKSKQAPISETIINQGSGQDEADQNILSKSQGSDASFNKVIENPPKEVDHLENNNNNKDKDKDKENNDTAKQAPTEQLDLVSVDDSNLNQAELTSDKTESSGDEDKTNKGSTLPEQVFSLILKSEGDKNYLGNDFLPIMLSQGLRHGEMDIFHRQIVNPQAIKSRDRNQPKAALLYSVANAINPGTFDIDNIESFETPAFAFFMTVPGPSDPLMAFDAMVKTARLLQSELGGQLLDETKSVFTKQTELFQRDKLQHYLQQTLSSRH